MDKRFEDARSVNKGLGAKFLNSYSNLVSVGVGHKIVNNLSTGEPCITIGVLKKGSFKKGETLPKTIKGIKTDIVEEDYPSLCLDHKAERRPLVGGISVGPSDHSSAGTLGCCVYHNALGSTKCAISNAHVLTYYKGLYPSPTTNPTKYLACSSIGFPIQPAQIDPGGSIFDDVGYMLPYVPTALLQGVDAAVFVVEGEGVTITPNSILGITLPNGLAYVANSLAIGDPVTKSGRTSGVTTGTVVALDVTTTPAYPACTAGSTHAIRMLHQIKTTSMISSGDSGSILLKNSGNKPVTGLLFASSSTYSYANEWGRVQTVLGIHL